jgi:hypothetical protein
VWSLNDYHDLKRSGLGALLFLVQTLWICLVLQVGLCMGVFLNSLFGSVGIACVACRTVENGEPACPDFFLA